MASKKPVLIGIALATLVLLFTSSITAPAQTTNITDSTRIFDKNYTRQGESIYINTLTNPIKLAGQDIKIKWFIPKEIVYEENKKGELEHEWLHTMPITLDACNGELTFTTTYPSNTEILWDYNILLPNYNHTPASALCLQAYDKDSCWINDKENGIQGYPQFCDLGLKDNICNYTQKTFNGTYDYIPKDKWRSVDSIASCPILPNKVQKFRQVASIPINTRIVFDINAKVTMPTVGEFTLIIPKPEWISDEINDYNTGIGYDFNWTQLTQDANILPVGNDRLYVQNNGNHYDQNLLGYWRFNDTNSNGTGTPDDTNNGNTGLLVNGIDINAFGLWDTNALDAGEIDNFVEIASSTPTNNIVQKTIIAWIKRKSLGTGTFTIIRKNGAAGWDVSVWGGASDEGKLTYVQRWTNSGAGGWAQWRTTTDFLHNTTDWFHVAITYDLSNSANDPAFYINGMLQPYSETVAPSGSPYDDSGNPFRIGNSIWGSPFNGFIEDVKLYNRLLTADEIAQDYNSWMMGSYDSPIYDATAAANWDKIRWDEDSDANNSITVDYRGCSTSDCSSAGAWLGGLSGANTDHSTLHADNNQYFQYRVNFDTNKNAWNAKQDVFGDARQYARFRDMNVTYSLIAADSCSCPTSGHWAIVNTDKCTLTSECVLSSGSDLHIQDGSLTLATGGLLIIPTGRYAVIENDQNLVIESGGSLIIEN